MSEGAEPSRGRLAAEFQDCSLHRGGAWGMFSEAARMTHDGETEAQNMDLDS